MTGPCTYCSPHCNSLPSNKDDLAGDLPGAFTKSNNTPILSLAISWTRTPAPALNLTLAQSSTKKLYQQLLKTYAATIKLLKQNHKLSPCK